MNVSGADIKGVELGAQRDLDFLPGFLRHFGIVANATLYYETRRWGARLSEAYRGTYLDSIGSGGNIGEGYKATNNVDFASHYNITPTLKVTAEAINLTNQHIVQFTDLAAQRIEVNTSSGRTFLLGVTAEF